MQPPPPPPPPQPMYGPSQQPMAMPPKKGGGCWKTCLIALVGCLGLCCIAGGALYMARDKVLAWATDKAGSAFVKMIEEQHLLEPAELDEVKAVKDAVVQAVKEGKFTEEHAQKLQDLAQKLEAYSQDETLTKEEIVDLLETAEEILRSMGVDMTEIDRLRKERGLAPESVPNPEDG